MITINDIKNLREQTNAPVMECKKALEEAKGDVKKAKALLEKWGVVRAQKKADRVTCQGQIFSYIHTGGKIGVMLEILCETDFVAKNQEFQKLGKEIAMQISAMNPKDVDQLLKQDYIRDAKVKIADLVKQAIAKIGENIVVKRFERFEI
ncbi:translation elongation factor Ts [Candidatus Microgenomates bacterium]|nr:translation elongation factor Ts [Candidatus Microgenomates bacterium]